jgi:apolipoprotein N-acyltransferase
LFTGIESYRYFDHPTPDSRSFPDADIYYESYNSSVLLDATGAKQYYHKSKLVPGVETLPPFLKILGKWFEKFGGTTNGYVKSKTRTVINAGSGSSGANHSLQLAPSICYESIYGAFMSSYVQNGANLITIITNDGWWENTPGHKQHMSYARLRAIENRTWVARSANTGIIFFIKPDGTVLEAQPYNTKAAIQMNIPIHKRMTFYTRNPDLLYRIFYIIGMLVLLLFILRHFTKPVNNTRQL